MIVDCNVNNATEPLTKKLRAMLNTEKPFIVKGPSKIKQDLQRTQCSLLLNVDGESHSQLFRAGHDLYPHSYTFCDLPEIPLSGKDQQEARLKMCKSSGFQDVMASMVYDEKT